MCYNVVYGFITSPALLKSNTMLNSIEELNSKIAEVPTLLSGGNGQLLFATQAHSAIP